MGRNECSRLTRKQIDLTGGILTVPLTKNSKPHSLPMTPMMRATLERRCVELQADDELFAGASADHVSQMAMRMGSPRFMLNDVCKLVAMVGEKLGLGDAVLGRILNHTAPKTDVLHRHYVGFNEADIATGMTQIQERLEGLLRNTQQAA